MQTMESWNVNDVAVIIDKHRARPGALLPLLHDIQDVLGYIPAGAVTMIAKELSLSRAEVHGVITYYHHFRQTPPSQCLVQVCRAEACQAVGAEALAEHIKTVVGCEFHASSQDGAINLEAVYCLGHCAVGPNIAIGNTFHARMTPHRFDLLISAERGAK